MQLIRNIDSDSMKMALVRSMVELSHISNINLIAEGVETRDELVTLINLGVQYAQGYYLQRPGDRMAGIGSEALSVLTETNRRKNHLFGGTVSNIYIENICTQSSTIAPGENVETVFEMLRRQPSSFGICVVENGLVLGVVTKSMLMLQLSGRYGFSLNQKRPISCLMSHNFLAVDCHTPIDAVSTLAMAREPDSLYDFIVVTRQNQYLGTVTIKDLLQKTTEIEVVNAKYQNPLTGLPGNVIVEQKIQQSIAQGGPYCVIYFDIDHFKAYNDVYGFENGDRIIKLLAGTIANHLPPEQFAGHIGGDDFVAVLDSFEEAGFCGGVIREFDENIPQFYNPEDVRNGYITAENRCGSIEKFPLVSLSVAGISNKAMQFGNAYELTEALARVKKRSKQQNGSSCCWL